MPQARPILFSAPMIRALLDGRKTQTRRIIKLPKDRGAWEPTTAGGHGVTLANGTPVPEMVCIWNTTTGKTIACDYGQAGDLLWVRENMSCVVDGLEYQADERIAFDLLNAPKHAIEKWNQYAHEDGPDVHPTTIPSIHMPRWASRLTLELTEVRVQRLHDIGDDDAVAEGLNKVHHGDGSYYWHHKRISPHPKNWCCPLDAFAELWQSVNGQQSWNDNPWVWALSFRVYTCNVDALLSQNAA